VALLFGLEETMMLMATDPDLVQQACDFFVELQSVYARAQVEAGAHAIWLGDCNAFSGLLSLDQYRRFAMPSCRALIETIRDCGAMVHLMNSEVRVPYLMAEAELGADIVNCGPGADMAEVRRGLSGKACYSGNLDPIEVLMKGTPDQIAAEVERIITTCHPGGGYLFCTGEMNPRDVPEENMRAMVRAVRQYGGDAG
jgi:uroporphyrinogen-III decarboxylase